MQILALAGEIRIFGLARPMRGLRLAIQVTLLPITACPIPGFLAGDSTVDLHDPGQPGYRDFASLIIASTPLRGSD